MAILKNTEIDRRDIGDYAADLPPGEYPALCVDTSERSGVERRKFGSQKIEKVDVVAFWFEVTGKSGVKRRIRTIEMLISSYEKSSLYKFLSSWLGEAPPDGFNTDEMLGCCARLTLAHAPNESKPGDVFVRVVGVAPDVTSGEGDTK